jgi:chaperone BCS1
MPFFVAAPTIVSLAIPLLAVLYTYAPALSSYFSSEAFESLYLALTTSPAFQSMLIWIVPGLISLLSLLAYKMFRFADSQVRKAFFRSITIKNQDENFDVVLSFISKKCHVSTSSHLAETFKLKQKSWKDRVAEWRTGTSSTAPRFVFKPSDDNASVAFFVYKGSRLMMTRAKGTTVTVGYDRRPHEMESLTITMWGRDNQVLLDLLQDALDDAKLEQSDELSVWVIGDSWLGGWEKALSKKVRPSDSVILDNGLSAKLTEDAARFQKSAIWYTERGIPYRRGYLLYGPPGTGKTSFVQVLAGSLNLDMCMLNLSDQSLTDTLLTTLLRETPKNSLIMIEDVDAIFVERKKQTSGDSGRGGGGGVTFSGLLNALDGVASQEGRITIMTTNHIERLDPALIRPGRIDLKIEINNASKAQARQLFLRFFDGQSKLSEEFAAKIPSREISMAAIQGHLLANRDDPALAVATAHDLLSSKQVLGDGLMPTYDHLRRVGLERFAYAFESFGVYVKEDFDALDIKTIKSHLIDLRWDSKSCSRFEKLIEKDANLIRDYIMCDVPAIKEVFRAKFGQSKCDPICEKLAPQGKGLCSIWQLKWFLQCCDSEKEAVDNADILVAPRESFCTNTWMTAWDFCKREGSEKFAACAYELEENGFMLARDFADLNDKDKLKDAGFGSAASAEVVLAATDSDSSKQLHVKMRFSLMDFIHAKREFLKKYPSADDKKAAKFARTITDKNGFGVVSLGEVAAFFKKYPNSPDEAAAAASTLITYKREPKPESTQDKKAEGWIVDFLASGGKDLVGYADEFLNQEVNTPIDVMDITDSELSRIFKVEKLGHRKQILRKIQSLIKKETIADEKKDAN